MIPSERTGQRALLLHRFLSIAACPGCQSPLAVNHAVLICARGHQFNLSQLGIPRFAEPAEALSGIERITRLEEAAAYAALHAFAGAASRRGEAEGLYRTAGDFLSRSLRAETVEWILDLGCGSGRTLVDAASTYPQAFVVGLDLNEQALEVAYAAAVLRGNAVEADLRRWGFGYRSFPGSGLANVFLVQCDAANLPFTARGGWAGFDAVVCLNLIDRVDDPHAVIRSCARVLRPGGRLVLGSPLNWRQQASAFWEQCASIDELATLVESFGFRIETAFDGLIYREIIDARGAATDWQVAFVSAARV